MSGELTRVITREQAKEWDLHYDAPGELATERLDEHRWYVRKRVIFTAPDDGLIYAAEYVQGLTENQEMDPWDDAETVTLTRYEQYEKTVTAWRPVGSAPAPAEPPAQYAVIEAMGHRTLIGAISDATIAGKAMLRLRRLDGHGEHYLAPDSLYMVTPCSQAQARAAASRLWGGLPSTVLAALGDGKPDDDEDDAIAREEAGEDWNAPGRVRDDHEHGEEGDDASDAGPF